MIHISRQPDHSRPTKRERGAAALEFALVMPLLVYFLYGMVQYGLIFTLQHAMTAAARDAARSTVACAPDADQTAYSGCIAARARGTAQETLSWLSADMRSRILGESGDAVVVNEGYDATLDSWVVEVRVEYPNYSGNPILPVISIANGMYDLTIPPLPNQLVGRAVVAL